MHGASPSRDTTGNPIIIRKLDQFVIHCNFKPLSESQSNIADKTCEIDNALAQLDNETSGYMDENEFCRRRPLNANEITNGSAVSVVSFDSSPNDIQVIRSDSYKKQFKFDHVFRPEGNQDAVSAQTKPIVISVLGGYHVGIFAYGQIGTSKTFDDGGNTSIMLVARFSLVQKGWS
ncbi:hypothetical protein VNO77_04594 [Canavalia gladiata]|uniref:Kinesin motor domain-containing protein n=1 Tax=Canavalia gladiata TaxID=3824 RepID=A0AAN9R980_CANGL